MNPPRRLRLLPCMVWMTALAAVLGGPSGLCLASAKGKIRVLAWSERTEPEVVYPTGINGAMAEILANEEDMTVTTANLSDPEQGAGEEALRNADVLIWFGHRKHKEVSEETVDRILRHVRERGMGYLPLHSSHYARPFQKAMETIARERGKPLEGIPGKWAKVRNEGRAELIHVKAPGHPIADGVQDFTIPKTETYWNPFNVPAADEKILEGRYDHDQQDGSDGLLWKFGKGNIFYFRPGHESYPIYYQHEIQFVLINAVRFLAESR